MHVLQVHRVVLTLAQTEYGSDKTVLVMCCVLRHERCKMVGFQPFGPKNVDGQQLMPSREIIQSHGVGCQQEGRYDDLAFSICRIFLCIFQIAYLEFPLHSPTARFVSAN
jgi:hypothetical protein